MLFSGCDGRKSRRDFNNNISLLFEIIHDSTRQTTANNAAVIPKLLYDDDNRQEAWRSERDGTS